MLEAKIDGLALDMTTNTPVVVLSPHEIDKVLPIWIGHAEAWAIAMELSGMGANRPMTHDLLKHIIETLGGEVNKVEVTELKEQTFFAVIHITKNGETTQIDARPSDSLALALKTGAKIFVNEELFTEKPKDSQSETEMPTDPESLRDRLRRINPEDFGKYSL